MHRAKEYLHNVGEEILETMEGSAEKLTVQNVSMVADLCQDYKYICQFLEYYEECEEGKLHESMNGENGNGKSGKMGGGLFDHKK